MPYPIVTLSRPVTVSRITVSLIVGKHAGASAAMPLRTTSPKKLLAIVALFVPPTGSNLFKGLTSVGESNGVIRCRLIAPDDHVDIERIELYAAARSSGVLGGAQSGSGAEKGVENNFASKVPVVEREVAR
jgi:hypothetical protein